MQNAIDRPEIPKDEDALNAIARAKMASSHVSAPAAQISDAVPYVGGDNPDRCDIDTLKDGFLSAYTLVEDVVLKSYVTQLSGLDIVPLRSNDDEVDNIRMFRVTRMVYERDESAIYKFAGVFNAAAETNCAVVTIAKGLGDRTEFYMGIRSLDNRAGAAQTSYKVLEDAMRGQFPGIGTEAVTGDRKKTFLSSIENNECAASVTCVANNKNKDFVENRTYLQGLEKLARSMRGRKYTAIIIANPVSRETLNDVRGNYENIYTQISPFASGSLSYGRNESSSKTLSANHGTTKSNTESKSVSESTSTNSSRNLESVSESSPTSGSKAGSIFAAAMGLVGTAIGSVLFPGAGAVAPMVGNQIGAALGGSVSAAVQKNVTRTRGGGSESSGTSKGTTNTNSTSEGTSDGFSVSLGLTTGSTQNIQLNFTNKYIADMLKRIDSQIERIDEFESVGMFECAAYFLSDDPASAKAAASTYKALMSGEGSGVELSAINSWRRGHGGSDVLKYLRRLTHPRFRYRQPGLNIDVSPACFVSGNELAIQMGLPRKSVSGLPVIEHADFGKEVCFSDGSRCSRGIDLGNVVNMGCDEELPVHLEINSLAMHTFITGSTGSGKSNTVYEILHQIMERDRKFMVIEPAKGEYKNVFGNMEDVHVFGTNPKYSRLLRINPFRFPDGVHVLEHVDRLVEIFNVCWPMYAAMPAVLKDAVLDAYKTCGWSLYSSECSSTPKLFPSFKDVEAEIERVIKESAYSEELKGNYIGSLVTRIKSLTNGLNGQIFTSDEIDEAVLFDENVIVDLSRVTSSETKALIMGILVMRLSEYRASATLLKDDDVDDEDNSGRMNASLHHVTVLEEAHNILRASSISSSSDGGNIGGKSVEMLSNAIAEMRTYGEGFIIADQSPGAVDISAIRNTNTKIIMRLPEENDRRAVGKSAGLRDDQIDEIARLPRGRAVVYQNDWLEPVLCSVKKFSGKDNNRFIYSHASDEADHTGSMKFVSLSRVKHEVLKLLVRDFMFDPDEDDIDTEMISENIRCCGMSSAHVRIVEELVTRYRYVKSTAISGDDMRVGIPEDAAAKLVLDMLDCRREVARRLEQTNLPKDMTRSMADMVRHETGIEPSDYMASAIAKCLIKDWADRIGRKDIYDAWNKAEEVSMKGDVVYDRLHGGI